MAGRIILDFNPAIDSDSMIDAGTTIDFYENGTETHQTIYTASDLATPLSNPLSPDAAGRFPAVWAPSDDVYTLKWTFTSGTTVTIDDVSPIATSSLAYPQTATEIAASITPANTGYPYLHLYRYGTNAVPGTTDMSSAMQTLADLLAVTGGTAIIPPDAFFVGSQVTWTFPIDQAAKISAYGSRIFSAGLADYVFKLTSGSQNCAHAAEGFHIDHWDNTDSLGAFDLVQATHVTLRDCSVQKPNDPAAGYAAFRIRQSDPSDPDTGSFWNALERCITRPKTTPSTKSIDIWLHGAANATKILNGSFSGSICILHETQAEALYSANAILVQGNDFEGYDTVYQLKSSIANMVTGNVRFTGNRYENGTTIYDLAGGSAPVTQSPPVPSFSWGNAMVSNAGAYLNNPNNLDFNSLDLSVTPNGRVNMITSDLAYGFTFENVSGTGAAMAVQSGPFVEIALQNRGGASTWGNIYATSGGITVDLPSDSAGNLASAASFRNTSNKIAGKLVWDSTNHRMMRARGPLATDIWDVIDGSASVTPA